MVVNNLKSTKSILALDVGARRVGVAVATRSARLPRPLTTLIYDNRFFEALAKIVTDEAVDTIVVGYPRGLQGQQTTQTIATEKFTQQLHNHFSLVIQLQDEALTTRQARSELEARGKVFGKGDIDALAATYILDDWLTEHPMLQEVTRL